MEVRIRQCVPALRNAVVPYDNGRAKMVVDVSTAFGYTLFRYGHHDPDTDLVRQLLRPGDVVVDGGAHVGLVTLAAAARVGSAGCVIAFEPAPEARSQLLKNAAASGFSWVKVRAEALADSSGERVFTVFGPEAWGSSSFAPPRELNCGRTVAVAVTTLDEALSAEAAAPPTLIKLDLEGAEFSALQGGLLTLERYRPILLLELEPDHLARQGADISMVEKLLSSMGYRWFCCDRTSGGLQELKSPSDPRPTANVFAAADLERLKPLLSR
jgi:FkbM family methyltransferase